MGRKASVTIRKAWEDKYRVPTAADLLAALAGPHGELLRTAREALGQFATERIAWLGIPWRWSLVYSTPKGVRPLTYLVPQPGRPLMVLPLGGEVALDVLERKLSRPVRDAILHAPVVGEVRWTQWELTSKAQVEELLRLARAVREGNSLAMQSA